MITNKTSRNPISARQLRVSLVNMPFADWNRPSLALGQLASLTRRDFTGRVAVDVRYLNQDMASFLGTQNYEDISVKHEYVDTGLGDWLFRQIAFPEIPDNSAEYFQRYYPGRTWGPFREQIEELRSRLLPFCDQLVDRYQLADADVVGFTSMFAQNIPSMALARLIKKRNPKVLTVMGGANCESPMGTVLAEHVDTLDYIFAGPALESFPAFIRCVLDGTPNEADAIPGIITHRNFHEPYTHSTLGRDHDINDILLPDYDSFFQALDEHPELTRTGRSMIVLPFETSRGCWWGERSHCTFCGLNGQSMGYRSMSPELAIEQFTRLFRHTDRCSALFCVDNIMPRSYPAEVFAQLDPPPNVSIFYEVKLPLSREDMKRMVSAHVTKVQPGVEALATSTLKLMAKGTTAFQNLQFLKNCSEFGIKPSWNLLIGFPREDPAVYERYAMYIPKLLHLPPPSGAHMVRFDRFSPYFNQRDQYELDLHPMDFYSLSYPFDPAALNDLAYFFVDSNMSPYTLNAVQCHAQLNHLIGAWREAWQNAETTPELRLDRSEEAGWCIRDSRSGKPVVHQVDDQMSILIRKLASPTKLDRITAEWEYGTVDIETRLAWLREYDMLFEEDHRALSLVLAEAADEQPDEDIAPGSRQLIRTIPLRRVD